MMTAESERQQSKETIGLTGRLADRTMKLALPARVVYSSREAPPVLH